VPKIQSEDCLNLNVYAPINSTSSSSLPAFFFIHGGAFIEGWNDGPEHLYEGGRFSQLQNILIFEPNYRLEALGFLTHAAMGVEGNFGIQDQRFALKWVVQNARAFGGDPSKITLGGQSAGAMSVGVHMSSPPSKGLFQQAIMESNVGGFKYKTQAEQKSVVESFVGHAGCKSGRTVDKTSLNCLRSLSSAQIRSATLATKNDLFANIKSAAKEAGHILDVLLTWTPTVNTTDLPMQVLDTVREGKADAVPLLAGTNEDEGFTFLAIATEFFIHVNLFKGALYGLLIDVMFPNRADAKMIKARYPGPRNPFADARMDLRGCCDGQGGKEEGPKEQHCFF